MMADPRARAKMRNFFLDWLELEETDLAKDKSQFPQFDEAVVADLRRSLELFIEQAGTGVQFKIPGWLVVRGI